LDNQEHFQNRCVEDSGQKLKEVLIKRTVTDLICNYDYEATLNLLKPLKGFPKKKQLVNILETMNNCIKAQNIQPEIEKLKYSEPCKKSLNAYLMIEMKFKQGNLAEVLIRIKSLVEYMLENYLKITRAMVADFKKYEPQREDFARAVPWINKCISLAALHLNGIHADALDLLGKTQPNVVNEELRIYADTATRLFNRLVQLNKDFPLSLNWENGSRPRRQLQTLEKKLGRLETELPKIIREIRESPLSDVDKETLVHQIENVDYCSIVDTLIAKFFK
jgi:plasmid maintenance system antidote protein VapI